MPKSGFMWFYEVESGFILQNGFMWLNSDFMW